MGSYERRKRFLKTSRRLRIPTSIALMLVLLGLMLPFQQSANAANPQLVSGWSIGVRGVDTGIANPPLYSVSCPASSECLALGSTANEQNSLFVSSDGGATWFDTVRPATPAGATGVALNTITCTSAISCFIVANTATLIPGAESAFIYFGYPGHWTQAALPADIANSTLERVNCVDSRHCWVPSDSAAGAALGVTTDGGATWTSHRLSNSVSTLLAVFFTDLNHGVAVGPSGTLLRTDNGGSTWALASSPIATDFIDVSCPNASRCWAVGTTTASGAAAIATTADGGVTWTTQQAPPQVSLNALTCVKTRRAGETACWAVGSSNTGNGAVVVNTTDAGAHWLSQLMPNAVAGAGAALTSVSCTDVSHCAAVGWDSTHTGAFLSSTDGGAPLPGGPIEITDPGKSGKCSNVAVITARGTNEGGRKDPHANSVGTAAYKLASRLPNGTTFKVMPLDYPATLQGFFGSISEGIRVLANLISVQINQCVTQQIVLIGHSQGSAVIEQYLSKYAGQGVPGSGGVVSDWITHVTLFGDPMRVPSESIDRSVMPTPWPGFIGPLPGDVQRFTSEPGFMAAVGMTENLPPAFTTSVNGLTRAISWCNIGDWVCDVPGALGSETFNPLAFHNYGGDYVQNPAADAAATHVINALPAFSLKG
jgi:photosystem II stability/assembly factor-like uncharacterized protein